MRDGFVTAGRSMLAAAALSLLATAGARSEPPALRPEILSAHRFHEKLNETLVTLPVSVVTADGREHRVEFQLTHYRPNGAGPFPLAIYLHGRGPDRHYPSRLRRSGLAAYFARRGIALYVPTRAGYGGLRGDIEPEGGVRGCGTRGLTQQSASVLAHVRALLAYAATQRRIDTTKVILTGGSVGGYTAIAAASEGLPGVVGVINFAGGSGGDPKRRPGRPCNPDRHARHFAAAGARSSARAGPPSLWIYSRNDRYWGPKHPELWYRAYVNSGGRARFAMLPPIGKDGHKLIGQGFRYWRPIADEFLEALGIKRPRTPNAPPPTDFARLDDIDRLPGGWTAKSRGYPKFLRLDLPRAFVLGPGGAWSVYGGAPSALERALARCAKIAKAACRPYAVDDAVVWKP